MTAIMRLHYAPDNASLCVRLALEELGLTYQTHLIDRAQGEQKSEAYLALNPNGLIPVLETPQGPMFETAAILIWLSDKYGTLLPPVSAPDRMHAVQWIIWLANTLHPTLRMMFYPDQYTNADEAATRRKAGKRLIAHFDVLSQAKTTPWLDDDTPSAHGCYLAPMLRWSALYGGGADWFDLSRWPRLMDFTKRFEARDVAKRIAVAEGLGATPFSAPSPCHPPEGTAL